MIFSSIVTELDSNIFIELALLFIIGIVGGKTAELLNLPKPTGFIVFGIIFGASFLDVLHEDVLHRFHELKMLALGLIGYNIGLEVDLRVMRNNHIKVIVYTLFQAFMAFLLVFGVVFLVVEEFRWTYALLLGAIATVTTPAPVLACIKSYKVSGKLTDMVCEMIAIDDVIGVVTFAFVLPISIYLAGHVDQAITLNTLISEPLREVFLSILFGVIIGEIVVRVLEYYHEGDSVSIFLIVAIGLMFGVGLAQQFGLSLILLPLMIGFVIRNRVSSQMLHKVTRSTDAIIMPVLLLFFTLSGAELKIEYLGLIGFLGVIYLIVRIIGKMLGVFLAAKAVKETDPSHRYIGFLMIPQGGVAIDIAILTEIRFLQLFEETGNVAYQTIGATIFTIVFASVIIYKIFGEIVVKWAYKQTGEQWHEEEHLPHKHLV